MSQEISKKEMDKQFAKLPFKIFLLVADADGQIDVDEYTKFVELVAKKNVFKNSYARGVLHKTSTAYNSLKMAYGMGKIQKSYDRVGELLDIIYGRLLYTDCKEFTEDMEHLAVSIAESSGDKGGFFSKKKMISANEQEALDKLHELFKTHLQKTKDDKKAKGVLSAEEEAM